MTWPKRGPARECVSCSISFEPIMDKLGRCKRNCDTCRAIMKRRKPRPGGYPEGITQKERDDYDYGQKDLRQVR